MQEPLEIAFHNMEPSAAVEAEIRKRFAKLDALFNRITACRISVEALHQQHRTGNLYELHIDMIVPGAELVVSREPHKARQRYANPDIYTSIRDAFKTAERQLIDYKHRLRGDVKTPAEPEAVRGQVSQLYPDEDHGFILTNTGTQLYFHRNSLMVGDFDDLEVGAFVQYVETMGDTGPTASKIWPVSSPAAKASPSGEDERQERMNG